MNSFLLYYLIGINILTFFIFGLDKKRAVRGGLRIPEKTLFILCFLGGAYGGYIGMYTFHHKTKHKSFTITVPLIMIVLSFVIWLLIEKGVM